MNKTPDELGSLNLDELYTSLWVNEAKEQLTQYESLKCDPEEIKYDDGEFIDKFNVDSNIDFIYWTIAENGPTLMGIKLIRDKNIDVVVDCEMTVIENPYKVKYLTNLRGPGPSSTALLNLGPESNNFNPEQRSSAYVLTPIAFTNYFLTSWNNRLCYFYSKSTYHQTESDLYPITREASKKFIELYRSIVYNNLFSWTVLPQSLIDMILLCIFDFDF